MLQDQYICPPSEVLVNRLLASQHRDRACKHSLAETGFLSVTARGSSNPVLLIRYGSMDNQSIRLNGRWYPTQSSSRHGHGCAPRGQRQLCSTKLCVPNKIRILQMHQMASEFLDQNTFVIPVSRQNLPPPPPQSTQQAMERLGVPSPAQHRDVPTGGGGV